MNMLENIPYNDDRMGSRRVVDEKHIMIMQIALKPGQVVPLHKANSNVHLLVLKGAVTVNLNGADTQLSEGGLLPVEYQTAMTIKNTGSDNAAFLVLKTPNPAEIIK